MPNKDITLIKNALLITMCHNQSFEGDILIKNGVIKKIGKNLKVNKGRIIDGSNLVILPGLINAHFHFGETVFRGLIKKGNLEDYLKFTIDFNKKHKNYDEFRVSSANISATESMLTGTTMVCASRNWEIARKCGLRAIACYPLMKTQKIKSFLNNIPSQYEIALKNKTPLISIGIFLHSLPYVNQNILKILKKLMKQGKISLLTVHTGESKAEVEKTVKLYGKKPIEVLNQYGLLNKKTLLVHCVHLSKNEKNLILKKKPAVCLCPISNLQLKEKLPDINFFLNNNVRFCLGTDGLATGGSASLLSVAKITGLLFNNPKLTEKKLLSLITKDAANCLSKKLGIIKEGMPADLAMFSRDSIGVVKNSTALYNIIFAMTNYQVESLMIQGKFISKKELLKANTINRFELKKLLTCVKSV